MKILLTGATGFIGRKLVIHLFRQNHEVVLLSRKSSPSFFGIPLEQYECDLVQGNIPQEALQNVDAVIHLAGESLMSKRWNNDQKKKIRESRTLGTQNLFKAIQGMSGKKPQLVISASAIGIYGNRGDELLTEESSLGSDFLAEVCKEWENEAQSQKTENTRIITIRIGAVLGKDGGALQQLIPLFKAGLSGKVASGKQWMSWIHVDDLVHLFSFLMNTPELQGIVNAVAPNPVLNQDFTKCLRTALNRPAFFPVPKLALNLAFGERGDVVLSSTRVSAQKLEGLGFHFQHPELDGALKNICENAYDHEFTVFQIVPKPIEEIFSFFNDADNLETITPPWLQFHVEGVSSPEIREKTLIDYSLKIHGIPIRWQSRIEDWKPNERFSDNQLKGPYAKWHHTHTFESVRNGTLLTDQIFYRLPFDFISDPIAGGKVRKDIEEIFNFRRIKIEEIFGK